MHDHTKYAGTQPAVTAPYGILNTRMVDVSDGSFTKFALYRQVYPEREYEWDTPYTLGKRNRTKLTKLNAHLLTNEHKYGHLSAYNYIITAYNYINVEHKTHTKGCTCTCTYLSRVPFQHAEELEARAFCLSRVPLRIADCLSRVRALLELLGG